MNFILWVVESVLLYGVFVWLIPQWVDGVTQDSWLKLPIMIVFGLIAAFLIAGLHYLPWLFLILWFPSIKYYVGAISAKELEAQTGYKANRVLFLLSHYGYAIVAIGFGWLLQAQLTETHGHNVILLSLYWHPARWQLLVPLSLIVMSYLLVLNGSMRGSKTPIVDGVLALCSLGIGVLAFAKGGWAWLLLSIIIWFLSGFITRPTAAATYQITRRQ